VSRFVAVPPLPGLYVNGHVPDGAAYKLNADAFGVEGLSGGPFAVAISEADWLRIQGPALERWLDDLTRQYADRGIEGIQRWLDGLREQQPLWRDP
jgi:hypothetical protein